MVAIEFKAILLLRIPLFSRTPTLAIEFKAIVVEGSLVLEWFVLLVPFVADSRMASSA